MPYQDTNMMDINKATALMSNDVNIANHKLTIEQAALGPADPRQSNDQFWQDKGNKWDCTEGDARGRLCSNCEHFIETTQVKNCIDNGPAANFKTSMVDPSIVDIESKPVAWCNMYNITCSPTRTCASQEMGGPIDDVKMRAIQLAQAANEQLDIGEFKDPFNDSTEEM